MSIKSTKQLPPVVLDESEYYTTALVMLVKHTLFHCAPRDGQFVCIYHGWTGSGNYEYHYAIVTSVTPGAYSLAELRQWIDAGDLYDAKEVFSNVYKSVYGCRPTYGTKEEWADITWLRKQIDDCHASERSYSIEMEHMYD